MAMLIEKWVAKIYRDDIFITQVWFMETPKRLKVKRRPNGDGNNTALGFNGTKVDHSELLRWRRVFSKDEPFLFDTYEEAREHISDLIKEKYDAAQRLLAEANALRSLFNSVEYHKKENDRALL